MSIKHTPSPMKQSLPELRICGAASFADRKTEKDKWKNRAEMGKKGKGKMVVAVPCQGFERRDKYRVALHPECQTKC